MKDHILCAIDFSESSILALKWANKIAAGTDAHLAVLYSYRLIQTGKVADILSFKRKMEEECRQKYLELDKTILTERDSCRSFITEIGFYSDNIENFIRKNPLTMVVLSERLANEIYDHKGQTLLHFLKTLRVPLLIVPYVKESEQITEVMLDKQAIIGRAML